MTGRIRRYQRAAASLALTTSAATTSEIDFSDVAGGTIYIPAGSSITSLAYYASPETGGVYLPLQDATGIAVTQTVGAGKAFALPDSCYGVGALKIVTNVTGSVALSLKG